MYSNKQKFLPNSFSKCNCYHTLSSIHLKNVHEKKMQLTIFINKTNNKDVELIYGKYLNYITNYNCVNEPQPLNITIARNNKIIEKIMDLKNDEEKREILYFFKTTSIDIIKSILITYMKLKISLKDKKTVRKPNFFKNDNNEQKNQDGFCFNIFKEIKEEKYNNFNSLSQNFNEISQTILGDMTSIFHKSLDNKNLEDRQYFLRDIQNKIYLQSLYNEGIKETFILVVLAQVLEIIINEMEISLDQIKLILNKTNEILNYQPYLQEEISQNLKAYVLFTNEIFSKILDGEMGSCILLNNIYYNDSLIYSTRINPIIISLAFSIFKMKNMKKNQNDYVYSENNLPKATLILLEGYDHADNYRMVKNLKHLQIISIFIENDDLGISEEIEETLNEVEKTKTKKHFISIPLRNKNIDPKNFDEEIKSKDILTIFENIILPLISKYRPSFIIMTHSFTFCKTINPSNKISLNPKTLSIILYKLGLLSNQKIIVIPVVEVKKDDPFTNIELHKNLKNKKYLDFPNFLYERYHKFHLYKNCFAFENSEKLKSNRFYIYEMLGSCIHILSGAYQKDFVKAKPSYFSNDYARNSLFYSYILNLLRNKFTNIHGIFENLKRNTLKLEGKLEKKIKTIKEADFESFNGFENSTLSTTMTLGSRLNPIDSEENTEEYYKKHHLSSNAMKEEYSQSLIEPKFLSNKIMLIEKENMQSHTFDLIFHDSIQFYYSEHTVYCVHYLTKQIFFFNNLMIYDNDKMRYENFVAEFDFENLEKKCIVKTMPFYNEDQTDCLLDFSLCYSQTTIYLIWGNFQKNQIIFQDLYALDVTNHNWRIIKLKSMGIITPRLNASSACFNIQKTNSIFVFGGYVNLSNSEKDIHNSVDEISFNDGEDVAHHYQFPKANYKNNYKPLLDSQAIPIITLKTSPFYILLLGGTFSKFLCNQDRKPLTAYLIKIDSEEKKVYFENLAKHPEFTKKNHESLNLLFASKNKNYFFDNLNKKNGIVLSLFSTQKKGLFLEFYQNLEEEMDYDKIIQHQALKKYESFTHLELNSQKKEQKNKTQKFFYFTIKFDVFNSSKSLLEIKMKSQNKSLMLVQKISFLQNFFQMESNFENIFVDEESSELIIYSPKTKHKGENNDNEAFTIQKISFSANDLKKVKNWIGDYIPIKLKATNYLLKDNIVYILVNNEKDTDNQRNIYTIDLRNLDKNKKVALRKFYDENHKSFFKDCSFISDLNKIYVVGGEWADKEKVFVSRNLMIECDHRYLKSNFVLDINTKNSIFFKSNLNEMQNPYLIFSTEFLFCINRKIIYNPYLELSFFDKIDEKTRADILKSFRFNENYLYGEFIRKKNIDKEEWNCFLVDLQKYEIVLVISFTDGMKVIKNKREILEKNIIVTFGLIYLGKISKPEGAAFLLSFIDEAGRPLFPGLKQKRIFFIDFEEIQNSLYKNVEPKSIKNIDIGIEYFFLNEAEFLPRLKDYSLTEEEKGICFAKPNYQRISFNKEIKKMFKDIEN